MNLAFSKRILPLVVVSTGFAGAYAEDQPRTENDDVRSMEEVSVTATREARATRDVPQSISVIGSQRIEDTKMQNVKDAIQGTPGVLIDSKNGGYDARLIIRGAGLKAPYGIREVMVLRDGVPMTDPDSFTRLDFIDTQDIERIEISKGPGDLYSTGSAGGAIQIISRSVFDDSANRARIGYGSYESQSYNLRYGAMVSSDQALAITASRRSSENDWRLWNKFDTSQTSVKHGVQLGGNATWESEISYSEANLQLPGSMSAAQFETFRDTGRQSATQDVWRNSGRYSKIWFFNTRYEKEVGDLTFKPRFYYNQWTHYHPVTGLINDTEAPVQVFGTDLEAHYKHHLAGRDAKLVGGVTLRQNVADDSRQYTYRDYTTGFGGRITSTLSDAAGSLANVQSSRDTLYGVFMQESLRPTDRILVDAGFRLDRSNFDIRENEFIAYNYSAGTYGSGAGASAVNKTYRLFAPKLGLSYKLADTLSVYGVLARADQVPSESEISSNPALDASTTTNHEIGLKGRSRDWSFDAAVYVAPVKNEIITVRQSGGQNVYVNAGETDKKGFEFSGGYFLTRHLQAGVNYAYSDYTYAEFTEPVRVGTVTTNVDRSGNRLPYVPQHQYGVFLNYKHPSGYRFSLTSNSWGEYYIDNANSATYDGYQFVTNVALGYEKGRHLLMLTADNLFDKHYAAEVKKDAGSPTISYYAAAPRTVMLTYTYALAKR